jgi:uncharacterized membrane protein YoaK (UPF0700 family)
MLDPEAAPESAWLGASLTAVAGFVDAVGYLTLYRIYAANMSGNTVALAIESAQYHWRQAFVHACPILAFFPGLIAGAVLVQLCKRSRLRAALMPSMLVETALLVTFMLIAPKSSLASHAATPGPASFALLAIAVIAFSMGLQNGALRQIGGLSSIHTYVTGTLLATAEGITEFLFWVAGKFCKSPRPRLRNILHLSIHNRSLRTAAFAGLLWTVYLLAAVVGALLLMRYGVVVMAVPCIILTTIAIIDYFAPLSANR